MNATKLVFLIVCIAASLSPIRANLTIKQQISIPSAGYVVLEHLPYGSVDVSYNCWTTNNSPFTVFVTNQQDYEFWKSNPKRTLNYLVGPSKADFNTQHTLSEFGMVTYSELAVLFFTNNVLMNAEVQVNLTIQTNLGNFFVTPLGITTLIVAACIIIVGMSFLGRYIKRFRQRSHYAPIEHSDVVYVSGHPVNTQTKVL